MAQGAVASMSLPSNGVGSSSETTLTAEELREILEYDRICQFRDQVLAGTHPRVKVPQHLLRKQLHSTSANSLSSSISTSQSASVAHPSRSAPNTQIEDYPNSFPQKSTNAHRIPSSASKSEINPILLEKSDDLIKAEIQLQRQRLERALREQIEQQRIATKALLQTSESLPNFDLSEVLSKALAIVHPTVVPEVEPSVGARSSASDSFDERTFYSSQHDTPEASSSSQGQKESSELQSLPTLSRNERRSAGSTHNQVGEGHSSQYINSNLAAHGNNGQLSSLAVTGKQLSTRSNSTDSRGGVLENAFDTSKGGQAIISKSRSQNFESPRHMDSRAVVQRTSQELLGQAFDKSRASPLIRAHNLSPHAPQPARVSPLATARDPPILRDIQHNDEAPPAQVAALRHVASGLSSTDSSPKNTKGKRKKKEKKRKTKDTAPASPDSPYIKPEPLSPEPFAAAPLPRPLKRQRQSGQFAAGLNYDEPQEIQRPEPRVIREPQRYEERYEIERPRPAPVYQRVERDDEDYRRAIGGQYVRRAQSPMYALPYQPTEARPVRAASHAVMDRRVIEEPRYYQDLSRASVRPDADRERSRSPVLRDRRSPLPMPPPRKPMRIVVDEYGNEYIDPSPITPVRQSMAPPIRYREPEVVYERAPMRAVSARIPVETYEDGGVVYERAPARRVVTQPEYLPAPPDYRSYRQREYSAHPTAAGDEFVPMRAPERRPINQYEEPIREYARAISVRPEPIRYELPREYAGRLQSVRPEGIPREYAASVHPEAQREMVPQQRAYSVRPEPVSREYAASVHPEMRREMIPQTQREYSVRPMESAPRREYLPVQEGERYYEEVAPRRPAEIAFIERPRAREASVVVYADDRREVYR